MRALPAPEKQPPKIPDTQLFDSFTTKDFTSWIKQGPEGGRRAARVLLWALKEGIVTRRQIEDTFGNARMPTTGETRMRMRKPEIGEAMSHRQDDGYAAFLRELGLSKARPVLHLLKSGEAACKRVGDRLGVDWSTVDLDEFCDGMFEEEEHRDITHGDPVKTAKIVLAHLKEDPRYYTKLKRAMKKARPLQGRMDFRGLPISVETRRGAIRSWYDPHTGGEGHTRMRVPYGYVRGTLGVDGDQYDVFIGPHRDAPMVYVIHQMKAPDFIAYDEDKAVLGVLSEAEARELYRAHYDDPRFLGSVTAMPFEEFRAKVLTTRENPRMLKAVTHLLRRRP